LNLRSGDEGGEESIELFDIHRPAALAAFEEVSEAVEFGIGQRLVLGEDFHGFCGVVFGSATEPVVFGCFPCFSSRMYRFTSAGTTTRSRKSSN
jgi:hypothetical protein